MDGDSNRFGRMFRASNYSPSDYSLTELGKLGGIMDEANATGDRTNPRIDLAFVFFGQLVDHDITLDLTSLGDASRDPRATVNFRTPALDLDCVFGSGPEGTPHLYNGNKILFGYKGNSKDLARNCRGTALIGDPRNDENIIVSQLQLAMIKFYNSIVDDVVAEGTPAGEVFEEAYRRTRWHYQWIVRNEFLNLILGETRADDLRGSRRLRYYGNRRKAYMPVEFSGAAYRYGHSQVPERLLPNDATTAAPLFDLNPAFTPIPESLAVDWSRLVQMPGATAPQPSNKIDAFLPSQLLALPFIPPADINSLATRNLLRGKQLELPPGQHIARRIHADNIYDNAILGLGAPEFGGLAGRAPLWYYVIKEADLQHGGAHLGDVGATIVGETLEGTLRADEDSYVCEDPDWTPDYANASGDFTLADLLTKANNYTDDGGCTDGNC